ncbi:baseplate J/gp47 family protein [Massilia sp. CCM 8734]|uniref:baseplate assembly protein n=1 Tax=Massilia sp. CCM 8734 TaxID=2609283 RepID=UPI00142116CA|nr:baseplate J/gp47 family protein [Massilia sp. CCM 8734]NIA00862.1 baseplate assembly protein [Massilia sp. CCM 8734]
MITTPIDLARLPVPTVVEVLDFETIYAERKAALIALYPADQRAEVAATLAFESEPLVINLQENAYREMVLRQRINDAARSVMLAYAQKSDLDHLAALFGVKRLVLDPGNPDEDIAPVMEKDSDLRKRVQLAPEGFSVAGPEGAYVSATRAADPRVLDASVYSPKPGSVLVTVLSRESTGAASADLLAAVEKALYQEDVRPLTDYVVAQSAEIVSYQVEAKLFTFPGPDSSIVLAEARKRLDDYVAECHQLGRDVAISGLHAALHVAGVERIELTQPPASIQTSGIQAPYCTSSMVKYGGVHD